MYTETPWESEINMNYIYKIENCPNHLSGIYKINFPNGKCYIGLSNNIRRRTLQHNYDKKQPLLYNAIQKYFQGKIPEIEILELIPPSEKQELLKKETYYILQYKSNQKNKGYNLNTGGNLYGCYNPTSKFSEEDVQNIYELLSTTKKTFEEIADLYDCNRQTINRIDKGYTYTKKKYNYPIRKDKYTPGTGSNNPNSSLTEQQVIALQNDLINTNIPYTELQIKYNIGKTTLSNFNNGKKYFNSNLNYPLRKKNISRVRIFTQEEMNYIKQSLLNKTITMQQIANTIKCDRKVISEINKGNRQPQNDWQYPIRKTR